MKRLFSLSLALCALLCLFVGCGNEASNDVSSNSSQTVEANESWNQICPDPIPDNKRYTVYCLPTSGVKAGIAADPATKVKSVENIGNLFFEGFQYNSHIKPDNGMDPQNNVYDIKTEKQENHLNISTFEFGGYIYEATYNDTLVCTETISLDGYQKTHETFFDNFIIDYWNENQTERRWGNVRLERSTGRVVYLTCVEKEDDPITTEESAVQIAEATFAELNGFDMPIGTELKAVDYNGYNGTFKIYVQGYDILQQCYIRVGNHSNVSSVASYTNLQKYIDAVEYYGKESIDEAINVLMSSIDDQYVTDEVFLSFDGNGELYCRVYSNQSYNANGCECTTQKQYCVRVVKLSENSKPRFKILDTKGNAVINEDHIYEARVGDGTINGQYYVYIELDRAGTELVKYVTSQSKGQKLPFYLDGELIFEPTVGTTVETGEIHILVDTKEQAESIYAKISSAMLGEEK